jgi:uncharacterized protein
MGRPPKVRTIAGSPQVNVFKPLGVPARLLETVVLGLDELEALRLADLEGLYQEQAAERMGISRPTFGRLVEEARRKVAEALFNGKALVFQGGTIVLQDAAGATCRQCGARWLPAAGGTGRQACAACGYAAE